MVASIMTICFICSIPLILVRQIIKDNTHGVVTNTTSTQQYTQTNISCIEQELYNLTQDSKYAEYALKDIYNIAKGKCIVN